MDPFRFAPWVSDEAQAVFRAAATAAPAPPLGDLPAVRLHYRAYNEALLREAHDAFPVDIVARNVGGVLTHVVTASDGARDPRSLLCLHGGGFMWGEGPGALLEAVPLAAASGMTVYAVDYRLAPEHLYPAAVDDALAVYDVLLARQGASAIGVYGCSAGAVLTGQLTARLIATDRPLPGAVAMLHGAPVDFAGDAAQAASAFSPQATGDDVPPLEHWPYFAGADLDDPQVLVGRHPDWLAKFPPSLLVTGSRDFAAGAVSTMHRRLLAAGVDARLLHFDGMWHAHHMATTMPEARETFAAMARFFDLNLR